MSERCNGWSRAFGGGPLWGDLPVRFLFMDEAGTSAEEPVTVVVALIADADSHVMSAEALALETLSGVPPQLQEGFVFSAKRVFNNNAYRDKWSMTDRLHLLKSMMSVPRRIGMAIVVSAKWRSGQTLIEQAKKLGIHPCQLDHVMAFHTCVGIADRNIRRHAGPREVATIVAEDVQELRGVLKRIPQVLRDAPIHLGPDLLRTTASDESAGYSLQSGELRVTRIRNSVHFVEKADDPLVQVADACAYGFRRYFAGETFGAEFVDAILGSHQMAAHFSAPSGAECWWPKALSRQ